jgi:hypothetical protein
MGTTLTALQAGSCSIRFTVAIGGYRRLLTNGTSAQAEAAWAGTDRAGLGTTHITGLHVDLRNEQSLDPWDPFRGGGGKCTLHVVQDADDLFGIDVNKRNDITSVTFITASVDRNDTTIPVTSTANFAASGTIYIGTEAITYSGKTGTSFTGCTRGKYPALEATAPSSGDGWSEDHSYSTDTQGIYHRAEVTAQPRRWIGRRVSVFAHRVSAADVLDVKAQAQLVYTGRLAAYQDAMVNGAACTVLELDHVLDDLADASVGTDMWSAKVKEGLYIPSGTFAIAEFTSTTVPTVSPGSSLEVVASGAVAPYQINQDTYTASQICAFLTAWLSQANVDGDIDGTYYVWDPAPGNAHRTHIAWNIPGAGPRVRWKMSMPGFVAKFLGFVAADSSDFGTETIEAEDEDDEAHSYHGAYPPLRHIFSVVGSVQDLQLQVKEERNTFRDQLALLPPGFQTNSTATGEWGVFLVDGKHLIVARKDGDVLEQCFRPDLESKLGIRDNSALIDLSYSVESGPVDIPIKQIFVFEFTFAELLLYFLFSTGTAGYNHATYDALPAGVGLAVPGEIISGLEDSVNQLAGATSKAVTVISEPITFKNLIAGELILRWAFPRWKSGALEFRSWIAPSAANADGALLESNKAAPIGTEDDHRTPMEETSQFARPLVKIDYNRDITANDESYQDSIAFADQTALEDAGRAGKPFTILARNTYTQYAQTGASVEELAPGFLALFPLFSRPMRRLTRTIDLRYSEGYSVGDVVLVTDSFARSPETGRRGLSAVPGIIIKISWTPGGLAPNADDPAPMQGTVELMVFDADRTAAYAPAAIVDDTAGGGGYNAGTKVLTCYEHKCSESGEAADASHFTAGFKVRITQRDPASSAAPLTWVDTVASQTGNTITLTTGLAGYDATKHYIVTYDDHSTQITAQRAKVSQADDADLLIQDVRVPFVYNATISDPFGGITLNSTSDPIELPADNSYGDGKALDVAHEMALVRLATNLMDYKTAHSSPTLGTTQTGSGATGTWKLTAFRPIFFGPMILSSACYRQLTVAPWMRSSDGTTANVRVTLTNVRPSQDTVNDIDLSIDAVSVSFTTTSTTWITGSSQTIDMRNALAFDGLAWILIECSVKAETRGLAICQEGPRVPS